MCRCFSEFFFLALCTSQASKCPLLFSWSVIVLSLKLEQPVIKDVYALILLANLSAVHARYTLHFIIFSDSLYDNQWRPSFHFWLKDRPSRLSFSYADLLAFLFSVDKSIGSGCFFPCLDPSVNLICHAAITEMIKLQLLPIGYEIKSGMGTGSWNLA